MTLPLATQSNLSSQNLIPRTQVFHTRKTSIVESALELVLNQRIQGVTIHRFREENHTTDSWHVTVDLSTTDSKTGKLFITRMETQTKSTPLEVEVKFQIINNSTETTEYGPERMLTHVKR